MKITVCGSITFMQELKKLKYELKKIGFDEVLIPKGFGKNDKEIKEKMTAEEDGKRKIAFDLINLHYRKILQSDCILVANYEKKISLDI